MFGVFRERAAGKGWPDARELAYRDLLYENNLHAIAGLMRRAGARVLFATLSQNFSDWPPPASRQREDLTPAEAEAWQAAFADARARAAEADCAGAVAAFEQALAIDDRHAELQFRMASCLRQLGRLDEAWRRFRLASDLDPVSHGAPTYFNDIIRRVAREEEALFLDVDGLLQEASGPALVGDDLFTDFAHPNLRAHQLIAKALADTLREAGVPLPSERWREGYADPPPEQLYSEAPELRVLELESRVFVCLLAPRETCASEAQRLMALQPANEIAMRVLGQ
jgi:tetratricopeptide (TPR) repeat protein